MIRTKSGLYIPPTAGIHGERPEYRCNVPGCDTVFYEGEERARVAHALAHAHADEAELREASLGPLESIFGEGDVERQRWLKERHAQLEGQVENPLDPRLY